MPLLNQNPEAKCRLIARLVRELLHGETFETLADLTDALKGRCARLHVAWTDDDINAAYAMVDSNTPLVPSRLPKRGQVVERLDIDPDPIRRDEAVSILRRLGVQP